jgi:fimbrial chaperone protein
VIEAWTQRRAIRLSGRIASLVLWLAAAQGAAASTFNISPIRANLNTGHRTDVLTMANAEDQPVVVQVRAVRWYQKDGQDQLDDTRDLLATPPVLQMGPKAEQIVRTALRQAPDASRELSYRLIFQEVPQPAAPDFMGLRVALRLSVPVFVAPVSGKAVADMSWEGHWSANGTLELTATNRGNGHFQVIDFEVQFSDPKDKVKGITSKYVLPGSSMSWTLSPAQDVKREGPVQIHGHSDQGEFCAAVAITKS